MADPNDMLGQAVGNSGADQTDPEFYRQYNADVERGDIIPMQQLTILRGNGRDQTEWVPTPHAQPIVFDKMAAARMVGHDWPAVTGYIAGATSAATQAGYSQDQLDRYLGYQDPGKAQQRFDTGWRDQLAKDPGLVTDLHKENGALDALGRHPGVRDDYADALLSGEVKGPQDFAQMYGQALTTAGGFEGNPTAQANISQSADALAQKLPTVQELTDTAIGILHAHYQSNPPNFGSEDSNLTPEQIYERNKGFAKPGPYITKLAPKGEAEFQAWAQANHMRADPPDDEKSDYDMRGFWLAQTQGDPDAVAQIDHNDNKMHEPDQWKTPYDLTFSRQSRYATDGAPDWNAEDQLVTPDGSIVYDDRNRAPYIGAPPTNLVSDLHTIRANLMRRWATAGVTPMQSWQHAMADPMVTAALADPDLDKDGRLSTLAEPPSQLMADVRQAITEGSTIAKDTGGAMARALLTTPAMSPAAEKWFEDVGIFPRPGAGSTPVQLLNKGVIAGLSGGVSLLTIGIQNALNAGVATAAQESAEAAGGTNGEPERQAENAVEALNVLGVFMMGNGFAPGADLHLGTVGDGLEQLLRDTRGGGPNPFAKYRAAMGKEAPENAAPLPAGWAGNVTGEAGKQLTLPLANTTELPKGWEGLSKSSMSAADLRTRNWLDAERLMSMERQSMAAHGAPVDSPLETPQQLQMTYREESLRSGELFTPAEMGPQKLDMEAGGREPVEFVPGDPAKLAHDMMMRLHGRDGSAEIRPIDWTPFPEDQSIKPYLTGLDDNLNQLETNDTRDRVDIYQTLDALPEELTAGEQGPAATLAERTRAFQSRVSREVERRLIDAKAKLSPAVERLLAAVKPLTDERTRIAEFLKRVLGDASLSRVLVPIEHPEEGGPAFRVSTHYQEDLYLNQLLTTEEGYVDRFVAPEAAEGLDPDVTHQDPITGARPSRAKVRPDALKHRAYYVVQHGDERHFGIGPISDLKNPETGEPMTYGDKYNDAEGNEWEVRRATMDEIEAHEPKVRYTDNFLMNLSTNLLRLRRMERTVRLLLSAKEQLTRNGLWQPLRNAGGEIDFGGIRERPINWVRVNLPVLGDGYMEPRLGNLLNDFFKPEHHTLIDMASSAARAITSALFLSPVTHIANVGTHWAVGRGWDWMHMGRGMSAGVRAVREVTQLGPLYQEVLRNGGGLLSADVRMGNFHEMLMQKLFVEQLQDEGGMWSKLAKYSGYNSVRDMVKWEYRMSRHILWAANDVFMMQRVIELMDGGLPIRAAMKVAEEDIPNYRIPPEVLNSRKLAVFMRSPAAMMFGRYRYGQLAALGHLARDLVSPRTEEAPKDFLGVADAPVAVTHSRPAALGKLIALGALGIGAYPALNYALRQITGNQNAAFHPAGPLSPIAAVAGLVTKQKSWASAMGSFLSLNPLFNIVRSAMFNQDQWGHEIIHGNKPLTDNLQSGMRAALQTLFPGQLLVELTQPGGIERVLGQLLLNANIPGPKRYGGAHRREDKYPL